MMGGRWKWFLNLLIFSVVIDPIFSADLYIFSVGVEAKLLSQGKFDLYSHDARHIAKAFEKAKTPYAKLIPFGIEGKKANTKEVIKGLERLSKEVKKDDVVIFFFSTHGEIEKGKGYYFELGPEDQRKRSYLYGDQFNKAISQIAGKVIVLADTCRAEGLIPEKLTSEVSYIVASKTDQSSYGQEKDIDRPHGYFVNAVCEGLGGLADLNRNRVVTLEELKFYITARTKFLCKEQTAISKLHKDHLGLKLARVDSRNTRILYEGDHKTRNPFGFKDVLHLKDEASENFLRITKPKPSKQDPNAQQWNEAVLIGDDGSMNGEWQSRWREGEGKWHSGRAWVVKASKHVYISYRDEGAHYLMELKRLSQNRYGGSYMNMDDSSDTGRWLGLYVSPERIDGYFPGGRWDLRRKISE